MSRRWKRRPEPSTWSDWGDDDQLGRLNLIGPQQVLEALKEVKTGQAFCLSLPLDYPGGNVLSPVRFPPELRPVIRNGASYYNYQWGQIDPSLNDIASDDAVLLYTQYSTQWDSLAHRGALFDVDGDGKLEPVYYNGYSAGDDIIMSDDGHVRAEALGVENMAVHGVQGRGVLVDLSSRYGELPRKEVGYDDLMRIFDEDGVVIERGDIVCFWTGLDEMILRMNRHPDPSVRQACAVLDGRDERLLKWIVDSEIPAIASDNIAVEAAGKPLPADHHGTNLPLHELCLFKLGVHLGELWYLAELAQWLNRHGRSRFFLTAAPLRLTGAVGSPVTPIATV